MNKINAVLEKIGGTAHDFIIGKDDKLVGAMLVAVGIVIVVLAIV